MAVKQRIITKQMKSNVDKYLEAYKMYKKYEKEMKELRVAIEDEMLDRSVFAVAGSEYGGVQIVEGERVVTSSQYSTYDPSLLTAIPASLARKCKAIVVDKEEVENLIKSKKLSRKMCDEFKMKQPSRTFKTLLDINN